MRFFHLADLHIGKKLNHVDLIEDQKIALMEVLDYIDLYQPEVVLLAGDIYDRRSPSLEAIGLCDWFLSELILRKKVKVIGIGGNHDSGKRLDFASGILSKTGLYLAGEFSYPLKALEFSFDDIAVVFHLLPFCDLATLVHHNHDFSSLSYEESMVKLIDELELAPDKRHVLIFHGMVLGSEDLYFSDSERLLSVGGSLAFSAKVLEKFDYVALGHLHRRQKVGKDYIVYSGSLFPYSFSEEHHDKGIQMVEFKADGETKISFLPFKKGKRLKTLRGKLEELLDEKNPSEDYLKIELTDKTELIEPMKKLQAVYPNVLQLVRVREKEVETVNNQVFEKNKELKSPLEIFEHFYESLEDDVFSEEARAWLKALIEEEGV